MSIEKYFCPSPWFHAGIKTSGEYHFCRWVSYNKDIVQRKDPTINEISAIDFFQTTMAEIRLAQVTGNPFPLCKGCYEMEEHGKVSGRQKQLLKIGVDTNNFEKTLRSSPWLPIIVNSIKNNGLLGLTPQDWQVDLGNFCNSACVFCTPKFSSKIATEFKKLAIATETQPAPWCTSDVNVNSFITSLKACKNIQYLHFLGGEPTIIPAFKKILKELVVCGLATSITLGFATNCTIWDEELNTILKGFKGVHLNLSIESLEPINDYVRYPSSIVTVTDIINKWINISKDNKDWLVQIRITPTVLSISKIISLFEFSYQSGVAIEASNFIQEPAFMRPSVLPTEYRIKIIKDLQEWIESKPVTEDNTLVVNTRSPAQAQTQILQDAASYVNYLVNSRDESFRLTELVAYIKKIESNRKNSILDYLPEYELLFKSAGL